jgi:hypothetical protein
MSMAGSTVDVASISGTGPFARVGAFTADGKGGITGGIEDVNAPAGISIAVQFTSGSYTIDANGHGILNLVNASGTLVFSFTLSDTNRGFIGQFPPDGLSTASGNFTRQTSNAASVNGSYIFDFAGLFPDANQFPASVVGQFQAASNVITTGIEDINNGGNFTNAAAVTGAFTPDNANMAFGRGTAVINGVHYAYYVVNQNLFRLMSIDNVGELAGDAVLQQNIPANVNQLTGGFVVAMAGTSVNGPLTRLGRFTATGAVASKFVLDNNSTQYINVSPTSTGTLAYDGTTGRGLLTLKDNSAVNAGTFQFLFYLSTPSSGVIQDDSDPNIIADGSINAQAAGPFTPATFATTYAFSLSGVTSDEEDMVGQVTVKNAAYTGSVDINEFGAGKQFTSPANGTLTLAGDGTGSNVNVINFTQPTSNHIDYVMYVVNGNTLFAMGTDHNRVALATFSAQPTTLP